MSTSCKISNVIFLELILLLLCFFFLFRILQAQPGCMLHDHANAAAMSSHTVVTTLCNHSFCPEQTRLMEARKKQDSFFGSKSKHDIFHKVDWLLDVLQCFSLWHPPRGTTRPSCTPRINADRRISSLSHLQAWWGSDSTS